MLVHSYVKSTLLSVSLDVSTLFFFFFFFFDNAYNLAKPEDVLILVHTFS